MSKKLEIEDLIKEISLVLKNKYSSFKGIYFFGSRLKGNYKSDSDFDMVFAFDSDIDWRFRKDIIKVIYEIELKYDIFIDVKVYNIKDIKEPNTPFRQTVLEEGVFYAG